MIFDTHCHLNSDELYKDIESYIQRANKANVKYFLVVGWDKNSSELAVKIANMYDFCYAAIGYHPENIEDVTEQEFLDTMELAKCPKVVAIGEIGLDYHWEKDPLKQEKQKEFFIKQIQFANTIKKPIVIHCREAINDCLHLLKSNKPEYGGTMHCYSGSSELVNDFINLGLYISLGGPVTFTNARTPKEVAEDVPIDKLLIETDSPYLSPHPLRGTINEPKNIELVLDQIAILKNMSRKHLECAIFENSLRCFNIKL